MLAQDGGIIHKKTSKKVVISENYFILTKRVSGSVCLCVCAPWGVGIGVTLNLCPPRGQQLHQSVGIQQLDQFGGGMWGFIMDVSGVHVCRGSL